jgi:hypothetical protein
MCRTGQHKVRHVRAGNQEDECDRTQQEHERRPDVADDRLPPAKYGDVHTGVLGHVLPHLRRDDGQVSLRLSERHTRLQPAEYIDEVIGPRVHRVAWRVRDGRPELRTGTRILKRGRQDANKSRARPIRLFRLLVRRC